MKPTAKRVLALWKGAPELQLTHRAIRQALGLAGRHADPDALQALERVLDELVRSGALEHRRHRYHLTRAEASPGHRETQAAKSTTMQGTVFEGTFSAHRKGFAFVDIQEPRRSVFVPPPKVAGALDGDRVRVRTYVDRRSGREAGAITEILSRRRELARGHVEVANHDVWVVPINEKLPLVYVGSGEPPQGIEAGDLVEVRLTHYPTHADEAPEGRILARLEEDDHPDTIIDHLMAEMGVEPGFSEATERQVARMSAQVRPQAGREDLRELPFVTIDGADARDFDDAICVTPLGKGHTRLLVAIADVGHYVVPDIAVDSDAYGKGTSTYFPHRVLPMLPERLSNDLCSLRPHRNRYTLTCEMVLDRRGERVSHRIYESLIRSRARLTYGQVQALFDGEPRPGIRDAELREMLLRMRELARVLAERRHRRGALTLILPEIRFELDEQHMPVRADKVYPTEATRLIEQFMLEANETVARHAADHDLPILYRVHDPPPEDQATQLQLVMAHAGINVEQSALTSPGGLNRLLEQLHDHPERDRLEVAVVRSLSQAQYRARNDGHFGLAATHYCHFTSPIRRYPDLLVHRALKASLGERPRQRQALEHPDTLGLTSNAGPHLSERERIAGNLEQQVSRLFRVLLMEPHLGEEFPAVVTGLAEGAFFVEVPEHTVEGVVPLETVPGPRLRLSRDRSVLRAEKGRTEIGFGDRLRVQLVRADRYSQQLEFMFLQWGWEEAPPKAAKPRKAGRRGKTGRR